MTTSNGEPNAYGLTTPDSWWNTTLEEVCSGDGGRIQTGPFGSQLHAHDYRDEGTPVVMPKQLGDNMISTEGIARISDEDVERLSRHKLREGDIVFSRRGDVTRRSYITKDEEGWLCGTGCMLIRPSHEKLLNEFLAFFFSLPQFKDYITLNAVGATMPNLNTKILQNIPLFLPSRTTQRKIVAVISAYDDLIENNTRRIAILEEMAQAIYREWFVHFRFPGHTHVKLVDSPLGPIPEGWEARPLDELIEFHIGGGWGKETEQDDHPNIGSVIRGTDIPGTRHMDISGCPIRFHKDSNIRSRRLRDGDIVFEVSGGSKGQPVGRSLLVTDRLLGCFDHDVICASFCKLIRADQEALKPSILLGYLTESYSNGVIEQYEVQSTGIKNFKFASFLEREQLAVPPEQVQVLFDSHFDALQSEIEVLGKKNANLRQTRDLLLPKLISGKLDVADLDIDVGLATEALEEATA